MASVKRAHIEDLTNIVPCYLPPAWDDTLVGYAEHPSLDTPVPAYSYQAMKSILFHAHKSPKEAFSTLQELIKGNASVFLYAMRRPILWQLIIRDGYPRWDMLDTAVIGMATKTGFDQCLAYNKNTIANILINAQQTSADAYNSLKEKADIHQFIDTNICVVNLGNKSPFFITQVN